MILFNVFSFIIYSYEIEVRWKWISFKGKLGLLPHFFLSLAMCGELTLRYLAFEQMLLFYDFKRIFMLLNAHFFGLELGKKLLYLRFHSRHVSFMIMHICPISKQFFFLVGKLRMCLVELLYHLL